MRTITPQSVNDMIARRATEFAQWLFPDGKMESGFWVVGSVDGESGKSCKVYLNGDGFYDFATSEGGDYIKLYELANRCDFIEAFQACKDWLGIDEPERKRTFAKAERPKTVKQITKPVGAYLQSRGLSAETVNAFKVREDSLFNKPAMFFPSMVGEELKHFKRICIERDEDGKKIMLPSKGTEPVLFGWQTIPQERMPLIVICEGEIDAMSLYQYGIFALSVPFGGGDGKKQTNWIESEYERLSRFDEIILAMDMDEAGAKAAKEIANRLGLNRCRVAKLPHKDANECLTNGVTQEDMIQCIAQAKHFEIEDIKSPDDFLDETMDWMFEDQTERGFDTPWQKVNLEWRPSWHEITIINGVNGHGKSELANQLGLHAAYCGHPALIASMELTPKILNERLIKQAVASYTPTRDLAEQALKDLRNRIWITNFLDRLEPAKILSTIEYAYSRYGIKVFVIDSLMKCGISEDDYQGQKDFVDRLCDIKKRIPIHIFLVTHSRKGESEQKPTGKMDVKGSGAITDLVDNVLICWRNKQREYAIKKSKIPDPNNPLTPEEIDLIDNKPGSLLNLEKNRNGGREQRFGLFYERCQFISKYQGSPTRYIKHLEVAA